MNAPKHTQSNWYPARSSGGQGLVIEDDTGRNVAVTYDEKDAALVAAAPELLEALKACSKALSDSGRWVPDEYAEAFRNADRAIAKAEGRT